MLCLFFHTARFMLCILFFFLVCAFLTISLPCNRLRYTDLSQNAYLSPCTLRLLFTGPDGWLRRTSTKEIPPPCGFSFKVHPLSTHPSAYELLRPPQQTKAHNRLLLEDPPALGRLLFAFLVLGSFPATCCNRRRSAYRLTGVLRTGPATAFAVPFQPSFL